MNNEKTLDSSEFRRALGSFTTGVTVVTTYTNSFKDIGLTANSFNSVSLDPPLVLWSLAKSSRSLDAFKSCEYFAIHILSDDQELLSNRFSQKGIDKFSGLDVERGPGNIPLLKGCAARFVCKATYQYEGGDHIIFVGEASSFSYWEKPPLLFHGGQYGQIQKRELASKAGGDSASDDSLGFLLRLSYRKLIDPLIRALAEKDMVISQHHFLAHMARSKEKKIKKILGSLAETDAVPSSEEIDDLLARGLIELNGEEVSFTKDGLSLRIELAAKYKAIESDALESVGFDSAQSLKILLGQLINTLTPDNQDL